MQKFRMHYQNYILEVQSYLCLSVNMAIKQKMIWLLFFCNRLFLFSIPCPTATILSAYHLNGLKLTLISFFNTFKHLSEM